MTRSVHGHSRWPEYTASGPVTGARELRGSGPGVYGSANVVLRFHLHFVVVVVVIVVVVVVVVVALLRFVRQQREEVAMGAWVGARARRGAKSI